MKSGIVGIKGAALVAIVSIAFLTGCDDYYPICIDMDGRIFVKERPYRVLGDDSKRKTKFGISYVGKGRDENNAILTANWTLYPGYSVQGKWLAFEGRKQNPIFSFGTVGTKSSTGLTAGLGWKISPDFEFMQAFAWDDHGTISGSTVRFDNREAFDGRITGEFWIQSEVNGNQWAASYNFRPYGESSWTEIHNTGALPVASWGFQYSGGVVGLEKGSEIRMADLRIWPGSLPEDATEDEELEYGFAKTMYWLGEMSYLANNCPSGWASSYDFYVGQAIEEVEDTRIQIGIRFSFKTAPGKKVDTLLAKTAKTLAKARKKAEKGAKSWSVYKVGAKARKSLFKAFTELRMELQ